MENYFASLLIPLVFLQTVLCEGKSVYKSQVWNLKFVIISNRTLC